MEDIVLFHWYWWFCLKKNGGFDQEETRAWIRVFEVRYNISRVSYEFSIVTWKGLVFGIGWRCGRGDLQLIVHQRPTDNMMEKRWWRSVRSSEVSHSRVGDGCGQDIYHSALLLPTTKFSLPLYWLLISRSQGKILAWSYNIFPWHSEYKHSHRSLLAMCLIA